MEPQTDTDNRIKDTEKPDLKFDLSDEQLKKLIENYKKWLKRNDKEKNYIKYLKQMFEEIQSKLLDENILKNDENKKFYDYIFDYTRKLEGPVAINLGESRIRGILDKIKRNLLYIIDTNNDDPLIKAEKIMSKNGEYKIKYLSKAFWTPIFQAAFPDKLPNWNNKTEDFLHKIGLKITERNAVSANYRKIADAFKYLGNLDNEMDFFKLNHLMHYGTVIEEGKNLIKNFLDKKSSNVSEDINYWIFQCNPDKFDIINCLKNKEVEPWTINQHKKDIKKGDKIILWVTGKNRGCYALAEVISKVEYEHNDYGDYHVDIKFTHNFVDNPIMYDEIKDNPNIKQVKKGLQGTNLAATKREYEELVRLRTPKTHNVQYWTFSPGMQGKFWEECYKKNIMVIGWDSLKNLKAYKNKNDIYAAIKKKYGEDNPTNNANTCNEFANEIKTGDVIIAKIGKSKLLGYGIVKSDYYYDEERDKYKHLRKVDWKKRGEWKIPKDAWCALKTLTNITNYEGYAQQLLNLMEINQKEKSKPTQTSKIYGIKRALDKLFISEMEFKNIIKRLRYKKNIILQGPPGVGKTFIAKRLAYYLLGTKNEAQVEMIQFHQSYSYEDFIQGFRPTEDGNFKIKNGVFYNFCEKAKSNLENDFVFIIDEINRGNLSKIFGELMMLIECDKRGEEYRIKLTYSNSDEYFYIPKNVYLIGTMNTADRSLALVDYALRRRFAFIFMNPAFKKEEFTEFMFDLCGKNLTETIIDKFTALNEKIKRDTKNLGKGYQIGHSYFCTHRILDTFDTEWYNNVIKTEIEPLIYEYWFDDEAEAKKIAEEMYIRI